MTTTDTETTTEPKAAKAKPAPKLTACLCGCGDEVKGRYRPGHDARHVAQLVKATPGAKGAAKTKLDREVAALSDKLRAKYDKAVARAATPVAAKPDSE